MAQINLGFTIVNMLYAVINKVIQKLSEGGVDEEESMEQTANPLSHEAPTVEEENAVLRREIETLKTENEELKREAA